MGKSRYIYDVKKNTKETTDVRCGWKDYKVHEYLPWHVCLFTALQQVLSSLSGPLTNTYIIWKNLCAPNNDLLYAELISTTLFLSGICTLFQTTFGVRLPMIQGSSSTFLTVIAATMKSPQWQCPDPINNETSNSSTVMPDPAYEEAWKPRLMVLSGSLCLASAVELILGCTGAIGFLMRFIGPITIAPTVALVGLSLFPSSASSAQHQWGIAMMVVGIIILSGFVLNKIQVPFPYYRRSTGWYVVTYPVFKLFPHLLAVGLAWLLSYILTVTDVYPSDPEALQYKARTDVKLDVIEQATWWFWPYPGRWGWPTADLGVFAGMLAATVTSIIESIGDYYATADMCSIPLPPKHALNRGIAAEGFGGVLAGLLSAAHATTSYSSTVGFIGITGIKSRIVWQTYGIIMLICGCFGKIGAAFSIIPDPILGGLSIVGFGMLISIGMSNLKHIDASSPRNMIAIGVSIMMGMTLPGWLKANPGLIDTGYSEVDQLLTVILTTEMFVGGVLACLLDNILPGTTEERGMGVFNSLPSHTSDVDRDYAELRAKTYDFPCGNEALKRIKCCTYMPFLPSYKERKATCRNSVSDTERMYANNYQKDSNSVTEL